MAREKTRTRAATTNREDGGAGAFAVCVKVATAINAVMSIGWFVLSVAWGFALPAAGFAVAFTVSAWILKGGAA